MKDRLKLGDLGDLEDRVVLTVTAYSVHALLSLVADRSNFVSLDVVLEDLGGDLSLVDNWRANLDLLAIEHQEWLKGERTARSLNDATTVF